MDANQQSASVTLGAITDELSKPFYSHVDFWISTILAIAGLVFSILAYIEAGKAKVAANAAGIGVKIQTITVELTEIALRLDKLDMEISYSGARDFLIEITRRLRRLSAPFQHEPPFNDTIAKIKTSLEEAQKALIALRPVRGEQLDLEDKIVYYGIESHLSNISGLVADLIGMLEKRSIDNIT